MRLRLDRLSSPVATLLLVTDDAGSLRALDFADHEPRLRRLIGMHYGDGCTLEDGPAPATITGALADYFDGDINALAAVPTATAGTPFQRSVWNALRTIPPGRTVSYG